MKPVALLIEDDEGMATIYTRSLEKLNFDIRWAPTLKEGILKCHDIPPPSIIFLDLRLHDSTDRDTIDQITTLQKIAPEAIILVISGFITPEIEKLALQKGACAVYDKSSHSYRDLWKMVVDNLAKAPNNTRQQLSYVGGLVESLLKTLKGT